MISPFRRFCYAREISGVRECLNRRMGAVEKTSMWIRVVFLTNHIGATWRDVIRSLVSFVQIVNFFFWHHRLLKFEEVKRSGAGGRRSPYIYTV